MDYLNCYGVTSHDDWEKDFLSPYAMERAAEIAEKYGAPLGDTLRFLRYLASTGASNLSGALASGGSQGALQGARRRGRRAAFDGRYDGRRRLG